jgi:hypothetical protein
MEVQVMTTDVYTANGHIYPKELMEQVIEKFNSRKQPMLCEIHPTGLDDYTLPLEDISHQVTDMRLEGDKVFATIKVLDTPKGMVMKSLLSLEDADFAFRPFGTGHIGCDGIVEDYVMHGISMMPADQAA